jgi:hypothetical protein
MTLSVKELSCPSFSTGEKKGNDSLEEELVLGTQMPILNPQLATDPGPRQRCSLAGLQNTKTVSLEEPLSFFWEEVGTS